MTTTKEAKFWNDPAIVREFLNRPSSQPLEDFLSTCTFPKGTKALDLGCGGGRNTIRLIQAGFDVYACDASSGMVEATRQRVTESLGRDEAQHRVTRASMDDLPYDEETFDLVVSNGVFHNAYTLVEFEAAIKGAATILRKNGLLFISCFILDQTTAEDQQLKLADQAQRLYLTRDDLRMVLLTAKEVSDLLNNYGLAAKDSYIYTKEEFTGLREIYCTVGEK